jgi:hypothetical protein
VVRRGLLDTLWAFLYTEKSSLLTVACIDGGVLCCLLPVYALPITVFISLFLKIQSSFVWDVFFVSFSDGL